MDIGKIKAYSRFSRALFRFSLSTVLVLPSQLWAADGALDTSFGANGKVVSALGTGADVINASVLQTDGKIVVGGSSYTGSKTDFALVRYNSNGSLDTSFGTGGVVTTAIGTGTDVINALTLQSDGKLVAVGNTGSDTVIARYTSAGQLDTSFGTGGKVVQNLSGLGAGESLDAVIQQSDGKLVAAGFVVTGTVLSATPNAFVVRFLSSGALDTTFGTSGKLLIPITTNYQVFTLVQQSDSKLVLAGGSAAFLVARVTSAGVMDSTFGVNGKVLTDIGTGNDVARKLLVQTDGKFVVGGSASSGNNDFAVVRYNSNGSLDTSFNATGKLVTAITAGSDVIYDLELQSDGKYVAAGASSTGGSDLDFTVVRYNNDGSLDSSFGAAGAVVTAIGAAADVGKALLIQSDKKLVLAGISNNGSDNDFALVRYNVTILIDTDGDGVADNVDNCAAVANAAQINTDGDSLGDACDTDDDNDAVADTSDKFPLNAAASSDSDNDGYPGSWNASCNTACQTSSGLSLDNCASVANADQLNTDGDSYGNVCDSDDDNDGVVDTSDVFPLDPTESADSDGDGIGDNADVDSDNDTVADDVDNCPAVSNVDQADMDGDHVGDVCDPDKDGDGVANATDKFPSNPNESADADNDGIGDNADADDDSDGVADANDNCPLIANTGQQNADGDAQGDVCDTDDDNDGVLDASDKFPLIFAASSDSDNDGYPGSWTAGCDAACQSSSGLVLDNCPTTSNANQLNTDGDTQGDACDADDDNDGVLDGSDAFPLNPAETIDTDHDGVGNNADPDDDGDNVMDVVDNCALTSNADQANMDGDAFGNVCDADRDGDGVANTTDKFPDNPAEAIDTDNDGIGNNSDPDDDGDGVADVSDNCPLISNADQLNTDSDGSGDVCDGWPKIAPYALEADADKDTLPDSWESANGRDPAVADYWVAVQATSASTANFCAKTDNGTVCWDRLGNPLVITPITPAAFSYNNVQLAQGFGTGCSGESGHVRQTCAVTQNVLTCTTVHTYAWANRYTYYDSYGNPYQGCTTGYSSTNYSDSFLLDGIKQVSASNGYICALDNAGIHCYNSYQSSSLRPIAMTLPAAVVINSDGDSVVRAQDANDLDKLNPWFDEDGDGIHDLVDAFPNDTDNDGQTNDVDGDDDGDGVPDGVDAAPLDGSDHSEIILPFNGGYQGGAVTERSARQ